jgi:hypothetical protein
MISDDSDLIASIAAGNQDALHQLYARYRDRLWRYLYHLLAEDPFRVEGCLSSCLDERSFLSARSNSFYLDVSDRPMTKKWLL